MKNVIFKDYNIQQNRNKINQRAESLHKDFIHKFRILFHKCIVIFFPITTKDFILVPV